ncbi:MAG: hypothetical protein O7A06_01945 [Acidobacteria bacterium]|nr:hypothetical protein [Acidobacteriota bacterium]
MSMKILKWITVVIGTLVVLGFLSVSYFMGGPKQLYGFLRYGATQMRPGSLQVGDKAPDVELVTLDGRSRFRLSERLGKRPLVLIFGSYT